MLSRSCLFPDTSIRRPPMLQSDLSRIRSTLQSVSAACSKDDQKVRLQDVSARTMAAVIARFGALGRLAELQLQRYVQIELKFAISKEFHAKFFEIQDQLTRNGKTLGAVHIADSILLAFQFNAFSVALEALNRRLLEP